MRPMKCSIPAGEGIKHFPGLTNGLLQRSPLSGSLFVMFMDWLLEQLADALSYDVGVVVRALRHFTQVAPVCRDRIGAHVAGKGVVVADGGSERVMRRVRRQFADIVPAWAGFRVERSDRSPSFEFGPAGGGETSRRAEAEWVRRTRALPASGVPPRGAAASYSCRVLSVAHVPSGALRAAAGAHVGN